MLLVALGLRVDPQGQLDWFSLLFGAVFLTFVLVIAPRLQARQAHRRAQAGGQRWVIVDATGFTVSTQHDRRCSGWPKFSYYRETTHLFVVISADKRCMTFVPKRALHKPDGTDRLRRILDQHLPETTRATPAR
ncbi:YcxB family protein [Streptomyces sp. CBMA152]|uniref:YcxB family protein n=1 Tax=Streptomyces sp. CBMA152 TaxID=1896312 RepID=UPI0016612945|nr:YcxB family protein [Streptomyces sp. CBMA152]